jgi:capsular exopolysaccharide synthesis family protein
MEIQAYLEVLRRHWRLAAAVTLVVICLGALGSMLISPKYQAEATLRMETPVGGSSNHETTFADRLINTYVQIATSEQVMSELKNKLGVKALPDIQVNLIPESEIIQILVESNSPAHAAKTANALAEMLVSYQEASSSSIDSKELSLLEQRVASLKTELTAYQQQHDQLAHSYSVATAELNVLERKINLTEATYQGLRTQNALTNDLKAVEQEWNSLQLQFKDLSVQSNNYLQQITLLRLSIQSTQSAYSNLLNQYDALQLSHLRQEKAQKITIVSPAVEPSYPSNPSRLFVLGLGVILGIIAGMLAAFLFDSLDPRIHSSEQIERLTLAPIIGSISKYQQQLRNLSGDPDLIVERDYWILRARLQTLIQEGPVKTILVTSPNRMEGKSTVTYKLALGLSQYGFKVLVVDADLRTGKQHRLFEATGEQGLSEFLRGEQESLKGLILKHVRPGIDLLPSLTENDNPIELLQMPRLKTLLDSFSSYDVVLVDTPAFLSVPDALALSKAVDRVVVVAQWGRTTADDIQTMCSQLQSVGSKILGTIFNQTHVQKELTFSGSKIDHRLLQLRESITLLLKTRRVGKAVSPVSRGPHPE